MQLEIVLAALAIVATFILFERVADYFTEGLKGISQRFNLSHATIGASIAAIGSSSPELFTSLSSVLTENPVIGIGTIVGSAVFNITVILGISAYAREFEVKNYVINREFFFYGFTVLLMTIFVADGAITRLEAIGMITAYSGYLYLLFRRSKAPLPGEDIRPEVSQWKATAYTLGGFLGIFLLSMILVESSEFLTTAFGLKESIFALIVIAAGTSIPDLFTSVSAAKKGYGSMAMSNALGSNIFDILIGLGVPLSLLSSTKVSGDIITSAAILFISIAVVGALIKNGRNVNKKDAVILLLLYFAYISYLVSSTL